MSHILIHKAVDKLGKVALSYGFEELHHSSDFLVQTLLHKSGTTYAVSVNDDLLRQVAFVLFLVSLQRFSQKLYYNYRSLLCNPHFLFVSGHSLGRVRLGSLLKGHLRKELGLCLSI